MARVKSLRRLCAKFAARANNSFGRRRHLERDASICSPVIAIEQESRKPQRTIFKLVFNIRKRERVGDMAETKEQRGIGPPPSFEI